MAADAACVASMLLAQSPARVVAQASVPPELPAEIAEALVWSKGFTTYALLDPSQNLATQLNSAIHWSYVVTGTFPAKALPVVVSGKSFICVVFRALVPLFMCPLALMSFPMYGGTLNLWNDIEAWKQEPDGSWQPVVRL